MLKKDEKAVTVGVDDTVIAAGRNFYHMKADHVTLSALSPGRHAFNTGYSENISHAGSNAAEAYNVELKCFAALADFSMKS